MDERAVSLEDAERALRVAGGSGAAPRDVTLEELLAAFGETEPTPAARERVSAALRVAGVEAAPAVAAAPPGSTVRVSAPRGRPAPAGARPGTGGPPVGLIVSGIVLLLLIVVIATSGGEDAGDRPLPPASTPLPTATPTETATPEPAPRRIRLRATPLPQAEICVEDARGDILFRGTLAEPRTFRGRRLSLYVFDGAVRTTGGEKPLRITRTPAAFEYLPGRPIRRILPSGRSACPQVRDAAEEALQAPAATPTFAPSP